MEVSLSPSPSPTRVSCYCSKPGSPFLRERSHIVWHWFPVFPSRRITQPLRGQTGFLIPKQNHNKVFCNQNQETFLLEARSIEEIYDALTERILPKATTINDPYSKYIVGLAGPPGAGKSTLASEVAHRLNMLWPQKAPRMDELVDHSDVAIVLPMDGFHLYRYQLDVMENPEEAHARRGAPWTFDPALLLTCLNTLRGRGSVCAPSFDHGVGDPVEDAIFVNLQHRVVIVEGNYLLLDEGVWKEISNVFDEKWFIEIDINKAMERVRKRHISVGRAPDVAQWRVDYNDRPNAEIIAKTKKKADVVIHSIDF